MLPQSSPITNVCLYFESAPQAAEFLPFLMGLNLGKSKTDGPKKKKKQDQIF